MRRKRRRARPGKDDAAYLRWIRRQPCCVCGFHAPSHAHHVTGAGMGKKAGDHETMPLCADCHRGLHEYAGYFMVFTREQRAGWQRDTAARFRALYERQRAA